MLIHYAARTETLTFMRTLLILNLLLLFVACSEPVLDATDQDSLKQSFSSIVKRQSAEQQSVITREFFLITNAHMGHMAFNFEGDSRAMRRERHLKAIDGMNAQQISAEAERIEQAWALGTLLLARKDYRDYRDASNVLDKVNIESVRFFPREHSFDKIEIEATISNQTEYVFYSAVFSADLLRNDGTLLRRYTPYFVIPDGIFPGEEKNVKAYSSMNGDYRQMNGRLINFEAFTLYSDEKSEQIIVSQKFSQIPTEENVRKIEAEYQSKYGDNEPVEWSKNISRQIEKHNVYRGF